MTVKIVGINVDVQDNGEMRVSITSLFAEGKYLGAGDTDRLLARLAEVAGAVEISREAPMVGDAKPEPTETDTPVPASGAGAGRRRRHQNPLGDGETGGRPEPTETDPPAPAPIAEPGRRRRRTVEDAADEKAERTADPSPPASTTETPGRRRTVAVAAEQKSPSEGDDKITDVDVMRACSNAAAKIGATKVKELLAGAPFDCTKANELFDAHRPKFLKALTALVAAES